MRLTFRAILASSLAIGPIGSVALGQATLPSGGDGRVARADFIVAMDAEFRKRDADGDGKIFDEELHAYNRNQQLLAARSANSQLFAQLDTDRNGAISPAEFAALIRDPGPAQDTNELFALDANHDRQVTLIEYRAATLVNFDRLDADHDGVVTPAEMRSGNVQPAGH